MTRSQAANWSQIADLRPQLRQHVRTYPQEYRGERWYVLRDESNGSHLRFNARAYDFIGRLDGDLSVQQIWDQIAETQSDDTRIEQDEILLILTQLFAIDALRSSLPADAREFFQRYQNKHQVQRNRTLMSPLAIRFPLFDPDRLLNRLMPWVRPLFSKSGAAIWLLLAGTAGLLATLNFQSLHAAMHRDILSPANLLMMSVLYVLIKAAHEFAHAFTVKMWGGEVHEMGITLLVMVPVPYVDASSAWGFRERYQRVLVGAAGILTELLIASLALFTWLLVEPGLVKDMAFNAMLIGSVSTLLFNANPLLRYDGYYVLQDLVEIPNLYTRSSRYYRYLAQRYLCGMNQVRSPVTAEGERAWFLFYGPAALLYRLIIVVGIAFFLAKKYLFIGVALATWTITLQFIMPIARGMGFLFASPLLIGRRARVVGISMLIISSLMVGLLYFPVPLNTHAEGVIWVPDQAQVFAGTEGFVSEVPVASGAKVQPGTLLIRMRSATLDSRIAVLKAKYRELEIRRAADQLEHRVKSGITAQAMAAVEAELKVLQEQHSALEVRSGAAGTFVPQDEHSLLGRYLRRGQLIGYVLSPERMIVRSVVPQSSIGLVRQQVSKVEIRLAERLGKTFESHILRETPSGNTRLPSPALGAAGGGDIAVRTGDEAGTTADDKVFQLDLSLPKGLRLTGVGERAYVRFTHGSEPLARQWLRRARQLVLSRLSL